eukprot:TRINITY_DN1087_c0_g1_i8.p2 TRINITY_DN1087_c0_g1~~TRINITY_DN1087_c0_g1_i8.p2  ORF type:complete len:119 (-),score=4.40 TRINITY_DN1087_c0_g1_i8:290-646(-)
MKSASETLRRMMPRVVKLSGPSASSNLVSMVRTATLGVRVPSRRYGASNAALKGGDSGVSERLNVLRGGGVSGGHAQRRRPELGRVRGRCSGPRSDAAGTDRSGAESQGGGSDERHGD